VFVNEYLAVRGYGWHGNCHCADEAPVGAPGGELAGAIRHPPAEQAPGVEVDLGAGAQTLSSEVCERQRLTVIADPVPQLSAAFTMADRLPVVAENRRIRAVNRQRASS
jgi:hypothetical protein